MLVTSEVGTFVPNLGTLGVRVLELFAMYATNGRTDGRTKATLIASLPTVWGIISLCFNSSVPCFSFCHAMLCKRSLCRHAVSVCLSVCLCMFVCVSLCLFVTFLNSVKTNKPIFNFFSLSVSQAILVFSTPNIMAIFRQKSSNEGVECMCGRQKS